MSRWLAIAAYQCQIDGVPSGSLDIRVRYFNLAAPSDVELALRNEPTHQYQNHLNETVSWPLVNILNVQGFLPAQSGDEIIGFIADADQFLSWAGGDAA